MIIKDLLIFLILIQANKRIDLDFENADIRTVIDYIGEKAELNIVLGKSVSGNITIKMFNAPWQDVLETLLKLTGYASKRFDDIIFIDTPDNLAEEAGGLKKFVVYKIRSTNLLEIAKKIEPLLSPKGFVLSDERTGQIIIYDTADIQKKAKILIENLDTPLHQVMIDVKVINIGQSLNEALEQRWNFPLMQIPILKNELGLNKEPSVAGYTEMKIGVFPFKDSLLQVNLLSEQSKWEEIVSGYLLIQENCRGLITTGDRLGVLIKDLAGNTVVQFFSSGFKLSIKPQITSGKNLKLNLKIEMSSLDRASALIGRPIITTYESEAEIYLVDGATGVISRRIEVESGSKERFPCLLSIPLIKYLFKPWSRTKNFTHQYILVTPKIVL